MTSTLSNAARTGAGSLEKVLMILGAKLYHKYPKGKSSLAGMRPALQQMGTGGISKRCARGWLLGIRFNTWNAAFRNGVTVGNRGGCAIRSVARGSSKGGVEV